MKSKENIKEAILPVIKEIATTCKQNLSAEDYEFIMLELATSLIAASINFNQPFKDFTNDLSVNISLIAIDGAKNIIEAKKAFDKGEHYETF